jgi:large subunit ribosomal protein L6
MQGKDLKLSVGLSHEVVFETPKGITITTPAATEVVVAGIDKQQVGQVAADIRAFRKPEPYKGKGIRYADEYVARKEGKKK